MQYSSFVDDEMSDSKKLDELPKDVQSTDDSELAEENLETFEEESPERSIVKLIKELPFPVGRKFLSDILKGIRDSRIKKFGFDTCENFGALDLYDVYDIYDLIDEMMQDDILEITKTKSSKYYPVVKVTSHGEKILSKKSSDDEFLSSKEKLFSDTNITEADLEIFSAFGHFLNGFNDQQKKAIIDPSQHILCVAGAGSGKTTVLTKRIEFLVKLKGVDPSKILAITFTRKARQEMLTRLQDSLGLNVQIETFNSFSEKILQKHHSLYYDSQRKVMSFKDRIRITSEALSRLGYSVNDAVRKYFTVKRGKDERTLFFQFMNDLFSLIDHYKNNERPLSEFKTIIVNKSTAGDQPTALFVYNMVETIQALKVEHGFRDYTDQIVHTIDLFEKHPEVIPEYEHILVDEYQDVNDLQVKMLDVISPKNLFVVGDPRQSIYGWRGSKIKNIYKFPEMYENSSVVQLTKNYRSTHEIVDLANTIIKSMSLPYLNSNNGESSEKIMPILIPQKNEEAEMIFVAQSILSQTVSRKEIFVLTRTNKQLDKIKEVLHKHKIKFIAKTTNEQENLEPTQDQVTLSTVHAIKGLEAEVVYIVGVNTKMYPCLVCSVLLF